jgi:acyl carrier protein
LASILERIQKVTARVLNVEEGKVTPEASFTKDLGSDSLDLVELIMAFEEEFTTPERKIKIADTDAAKMLTVQDALDYIKGQGLA